MGLIKAATGATGGMMADQWKEFFVCDAIEDDVLVVKGKNRASGRSSNSKGESNVISDGSAVSVADGQCMMIVEQGRVIELSAEPGVFVYKNALTPSIFAGKLKEDLKGVAKDAWERFKFGGGPGKDQRVYYFNTKELFGNKYGTLNPIPFKVMIDPTINRFLGISIRCNGEYSYKIVNPMLFYTNVCGNIQAEYNREEIDSQLKSEILTALQPALARISTKGIDYSEIPLYTKDITEALNEELSSQWAEKRGLQVVSFGINSIFVSEEDKLKIQNMQQAIFMSDPTMAAGNIASAQADAMRTAAGNENGAMMGFMGMCMAAQASGLNANDLFQMGQQQVSAGSTSPAPSSETPAAGSWICKCGTTATGRFCPECGSPKPIEARGWTCSCGAVNKGKFCSECGTKKPAGALLYKCDKCGWEPEDPTKPPKFCPECGDIFDENDMK